MSFNPELEPIRIAERRDARNTTESERVPAPAQNRAYRQLAIMMLGLDVPTLTKRLQGQRLQAMPTLRLRTRADRAA